jgi:predicted TIM-barrel fold metal-dependent hydrolase
LFVDIQCHIFPNTFVKELANDRGELRASPANSNGRRMIVNKKNGDEITFYVEDSCFVDPKIHLKDMDSFGIGMQILSLPPPGVDKINDTKEALRVSKLINDDLAGIVSTAPERFAALATIPMNDPSLAIEEIRRSSQELGLHGAIISSNSNGRFYDSEDYFPVFKTFEELQMPVFVHPTESIAAKNIGQDYKLALIFGWPFDTTLSVSRLAFSGVLSRFPNLKVIAAHGGGMLPFFQGRIEMLARIAAGAGRKIISERPLEDLKRLYFDAALFDSTALDLLVKFAGANHVMYASDYPFGENFGKECYESSIAMMRQSNLSQEELELVTSNTAKRVFRLME